MCTATKNMRLEDVALLLLYY